jgi:hypothetical protein
MTINLGASAPLLDPCGKDAPLSGWGGVLGPEDGDGSHCHEGEGGCCPFPAPRERRHRRRGVKIISFLHPEWPGMDTGPPAANAYLT